MDPQAKTQPIAPCENCGEKMLKTLLERHMADCRQEDGKKIFECQESGCKGTFKTIDRLYGHVWSVHTEPIECPIPNCNAKMKRHSLSTHIKQVHDKIKKECSNCGKQISCSNVTTHFLRCISDGSRPFKCTVTGCESAFTTSATKSTHIWRVHSEPKVCPIPNCGAVIKEAYLSLHLKRVHEKLRETCRDCRKSISYGKLSEHSKSCTGNQSQLYKVSEERSCEQPFATSDADDENLSHRDPAEWTELIQDSVEDCDDTGDQDWFSTTATPLYPESEGESSISYNESLADLDRTSHGSQIRVQAGNFVCQEADCQRAFETKVKLSKHMGRVHTEPVQCPLPNCTTLVKKNNLSRHIKQIHDRLKEECSHCGKQFHYGNLKPHLKRCTKRSSQSNVGPCEKSFDSSDGSLCHNVKVQSDELVQSPTLNCNAAVEKSLLLDHMRTEHNESNENSIDCGIKVESTIHKDDRKIRDIEVPSPTEFNNKRGVKRKSRTPEYTEMECHQTFQHINKKPRKVENIECPFPDCGVVVKRINLPIHVKRVHDEQKEECGKCGKQVSYNTLHRHAKVCTGSGSHTYKCREAGCEKAFATTVERTNHVLAEHNLLIQCPFPDCDLLIESEQIKRHAKLVHNKNQEGMYYIALPTKSIMIV